MRFVVYGAGAIGMSLGGMLALSKNQTVLIGREHNAAPIRRAGLKLNTPTGLVKVDVPVVTTPAEIEFNPDDLVFLTTKSHQTEAAISELRKITNLDLPVFCFQNGVRNEEMVSKSFPRVYGALVFYGAIYLNHGEVSIIKQKPIGAIEIGRYPQGMDALAQEVIEVLKKADYIAIPNSDIMRTKWGKLLRNLSNVIRAITGEDAIGSPLHKELVKEAEQILEAAKVSYETSAEFNERFKDLKQKSQFSMEMPNLGSMWQSVMRQSETEIDYFNGEIVRLGEKANLPTPINQRLCEIIREMTSNRQAPGRYSLEALTETVMASEGKTVE